MAWTKPQIILELRRLHKSGSEISYNALQKKKQSLLSAAAYHFGSYKRAIEKAGIDYAEVTRRPRWSKPVIIAVIKQAKRAGRDLNWAAVIGKKDELARAAYASLQPRLFGHWDRALQAAGLDADEVSQYRAWDRNTIVFELKERHRDGELVNSGAVQKENSALHAAAMRYFKGYQNALVAAGIDPSNVRQRRSWDKPGIINALKAASRRGTGMSDTALRRQYPALHGAAARLFGTFTAARKAAGLSGPAAKKKK